MKSRLIFVLLLLTLLGVLLTQHNKTLRNWVLDLVNPIKSNYKSVTKEVKSKSESYLFQQRSIERLRKENRLLRKYLLDQTNYLRQIGRIYEELPGLRKLPYRSVLLVDTISYVKLNKFDEVLLSVPRTLPLREGRVYGLIQGEVVAGTARMEQGHLYGYLLSNPQSRFGVYIGPDRIPGIAVGRDKSRLEIRFIPKWAKIHRGDRVETSGLDGIFFAHLPVGTVTDISVEESYLKATVKPYADTMHPGLFFLVTDARPYVASYYDQNRSFPSREYRYANQPPLPSEGNLTSVPVTIQTKELQVDPGEFEIPREPEPKAPRSLRTRPGKEKKPRRRKSSAPTRREHTPRPSVAPTGGQEDQKEPAKHPSPFDILRSNLF